MKFLFNGRHAVRFQQLHLTSGEEVVAEPGEVYDIADSEAEYARRDERWVPEGMTPPPLAVPETNPETGETTFTTLQHEWPEVE